MTANLFARVLFIRSAELTAEALALKSQGFQVPVCFTVSHDQNFLEVKILADFMMGIQPDLT